MADLKIVHSKVDEQEEIKKEIEEIQLPLFDIFENYDDSWFTDMISEQNEAIEKIKRDHNIHRFNLVNLS